MGYTVSLLAEQRFSRFHDVFWWSRRLFLFHDGMKKLQRWNHLISERNSSCLLRIVLSGGLGRDTLPVGPNALSAFLIHSLVKSAANLCVTIQSLAVPSCHHDMSDEVPPV